MIDVVGGSWTKKYRGWANAQSLLLPSRTATAQIPRFGFKE
jgi:hypothetical protein